MTTVARFRLFGRSTPAAPQLPPGPWRPGPAPHPAPGFGRALPAAPPPRPAPVAVRPSPYPRVAATPPRGLGIAGAADLDPPTDPYGFPPVPVPAPRPVAGQPIAAPPSAARPDPAEAAALAAAFAVDYLSWDEDDPARRGRVLLDYLRPPVGDPALLGWSGRGRQRGELALPGLVRPDGDGRVLVDVRVRVTPYRSVGERPAERVAEPDPGVAGIPAAASAPTGRGWRSLASCWVRLSVPVVTEGGRLLIEAWDEALGLDGPVPDVPPGPARVDHALVDDDPLHGGAR